MADEAGESNLPLVELFIKVSLPLVIVKVRSSATNCMSIIVLVCSVGLLH